MDTVIVKNSQFYSHCQKRIAKGNVNAEKIEIRLDSEWDGMTVRIHWLNVASNVERKQLLERDQPNNIPWEVLTDLGELRMGLDGMDGGTIVKPTVWLTYGYVVDGVDPESGSDPQPPTPSWEQQMVEQATQANQAAQAAQKAAEKAAESVASAGPYADEAKKSAEAAKASQDAAATSARQANEAAQTAQNAAGSIGDAVKRAEDAATAAGTAQQAAEAAQGAAARSAETAHGAATTANQAAQESNSAATKAGQYLTSAESAAQAAASARDQATTAATTAKGAAQAAASARDQATTAATTAQDHATAADAAKTAAEQAATTAGNAQAGAAQSAQAAAGSASAAQAAQQAAEAAAAVLPKPTPDDAGKVPMVNPEGDGYIFGEVSSGGSHLPPLLVDYTVKKETNAVFFDKDLQGRQFDLSEIYIAIVSKATESNSADAKGMVCINVDNLASYFAQSMMAGITGLFRKTYDAAFFSHSINLGWNWKSDVVIRNYVNAGFNNVQSVWKVGATRVEATAKSILIGDNSALADAYFGVGTQIKIWGW